MWYTLEGPYGFNSPVFFIFRLCYTINTYDARKLKRNHADSLSPLLLEHLMNRILLAFYLNSG